MCRMIRVLILIDRIAYLMIHKKGYQETDTSIISSITLKVEVSRKADLSVSAAKMVEWNVLHFSRNWMELHSSY